MSGIGIEPKNGWIAEYPVTPPVIDEIEKSVAAAADAAKLEMGKEQALNVLADLKTELGLNVTPGSISPAASGAKSASTGIYKYADKGGIVHYTNEYESILEEYRDQLQIIRAKMQSRPTGGATSDMTETSENPYTANPNPEVVSNYYYDEGPPVVTYSGSHTDHIQNPTCLKKPLASLGERVCKA